MGLQGAWPLACALVLSHFLQPIASGNGVARGEATCLGPGLRPGNHPSLAAAGGLFRKVQQYYQKLLSNRLSRTQLLC